MVKRIVMKREKPREFHVLWTKRPVKLIAKGAQVSEVKWLDTGSYQVISNEQLVFAKPD